MKRCGCNATRRLAFGVCVLTVAVSSACLPAPQPVTSSSKLAGSWAMVPAAINTELALLSVTLDDLSAVTSVTYRLGASAQTSTTGSGALQLDGGIARLNANFGSNTFSIEGTLSGDQLSIAGYASLRLQAGAVTLILSRTSATLTRTETPLPGQNPLTGTWAFSVPSTQLVELLLAFDSQGSATGITTKIGTNVPRADLAPQDTTAVDGAQVTLGLSSVGASSGRDTFAISGQLSSSENQIAGSATLRVTAADITLLVEDATITLAKLTTPTAGAAALQGTWNLQVSTAGTTGSTSALTQLQLTFDATSHLTQLTYQFSGASAVAESVAAAGTTLDQSLVSVSGTAASDFIQFTGLLETDETTLVGFVSYQLSGVSVSQQLATFLKATP